ncbi:unnamed protein product, partial [Symbiodinium pilosum]
TNKATTALGRFQACDEAESFDVNVRLSCDGQRKCLQLVFSKEKKTLGFIPTEVKPGEFILRGIWVNLDLRSRGLASIFLSLWIQLCELLEVAMATERIHKPVLSIVLQKFGFEATSPGFAVEVAEGGTQEEPRILVWASCPSRLGSYFSHRTQKEQGITLVDERPAKSRTALVNASFGPPQDRSITQAAIAEALRGGRLVFSENVRAAARTCWRLYALADGLLGRATLHTATSRPQSLQSRRRRCWQT